MLSIIIPTLNEQQTLPGTIAALRVLKLVPYEVIVSDGHSTDKTVEIAKQYANVVIEHDGKTRQNISHGRNAGAKLAKGEFVVFLDADTKIENPDQFFAKALSRFNNNPKLVALTAKVKVFPSMATWADKIIFGILNFNLSVKNNIFHVGDSTGEFQMIRKNVFSSVGGFREDLVTREDADMFWRLSKVGPTMLDRKLTVWHTGRRAHKIGWPKLLWIWTVNTFWVTMFDKAKSDEWKVIR